MIRRFLRHSAAYSATAGLNGAVMLLSLPLLTHLVGPAGIGAYRLYVLAFMLLNLVLPLQLADAVGRLQADHPTPEHRGRLGSVCLAWTSVPSTRIRPSWIGSNPLMQ